MQDTFKIFITFQVEKALTKSAHYNSNKNKLWQAWHTHQHLYTQEGSYALSEAMASPFSVCSV